MKKRIIILLCIICANLGLLGQQKVAVYVTGGKDKSMNKVLGDQLVTAFANSSKYIAIESTDSFLAERNKAIKLNESDAVDFDDKELVRLGKQFGVQKVCVAEINEIETFKNAQNKYISARLIDVESTEILNTANGYSSLESMEELLRVTKAITEKLTGKTAKEIAKENEIEKEKKKEIEEKVKKEKEKTELLRNEGYVPFQNLYVHINTSMELSWNFAKQYCEESRIGGFKDWRLPTINELNKINGHENIIFRSYYFNNNTVWSSSPSGKNNHFVLSKRKVKVSNKTARCFCVREVEK